jgi:hypothetical protein
VVHAGPQLHVSKGPAAIVTWLGIDMQFQANQDINSRGMVNAWLLLMLWHTAAAVHLGRCVLFACAQPVRLS